MAEGCKRRHWYNKTKCLCLHLIFFLFSMAEWKNLKIMNICYFLRMDWHIYKPFGETTELGGKSADSSDTHLIQNTIVNLIKWRFMKHSLKGFNLRKEIFSFLCYFYLNSFFVNLFPCLYVKDLLLYEVICSWPHFSTKLKSFWDLGSQDPPLFAGLVLGPVTKVTSFAE